MKRPGFQSSPDKGGAVGHDLRAVTDASVRRRPPTRTELVEALYHQNAMVAELLAGMETVVAGLDDDVFSVHLWSLQQTCLRFDRDLRARRR